MSKLSPSLKALVNAPFARPGPKPAPAAIRDVYRAIAGEAREKKYGRRPWVTLSAATTMTLNSPDSLLILHQIVTEPPSAMMSRVQAAELIREVGLKCISFNGIPRTINCLGAFRQGLSPDVVAGLETRPTRRPLDEAAGNSAEAMNKRGRGLWESVYIPFADKLEAKLADSHPDLPVHILTSHYGPLLSNPPLDRRGGLATLGRCSTSVLALACLRAQTGVGPQVLSHVFGLRKAIEQGLHRAEFEGAGAAASDEIEAVERLATDEGSEWLLRSVDRISEVLGENFAPQIRGSKL